MKIEKKKNKREKIKQEVGRGKIGAEVCGLSDALSSITCWRQAPPLSPHHPFLLVVGSCLCVCVCVCIHSIKLIFNFNLFSSELNIELDWKKTPNIECVMCKYCVCECVSVARNFSQVSCSLFSAGPLGPTFYEWQLQAATGLERKKKKKKKKTRTHTLTHSGVRAPYEWASPFTFLKVSDLL